MTKDIFWREKSKFGENGGMQETSQKEKKKVKYMLVKVLIKVTTRKTEIKHVTLRWRRGEGRKRKKTWYQANKKTKQKT